MEFTQKIIPNPHSPHRSAENTQKTNMAYLGPQHTDRTINGYLFKMYDWDADVRRVSSGGRFLLYKMDLAEFQYPEFSAFAHLLEMGNWGAERGRISHTKTFRK